MITSCHCRKRRYSPTITGLAVECWVVLVDVRTPWQLLWDCHFRGQRLDGCALIVDRWRRVGTHGPITADACRRGVRRHGLALRTSQLGGPSEVVRFLHLRAARDEGGLCRFGFLALLRSSMQPEEEQREDESKHSGPNGYTGYRSF